MKVTDIAAVSKIAGRARNIPHAVDNTFLTPYFQQSAGARTPISSVHSTTKYLDGHNATDRRRRGQPHYAELDEQVRFIQNSCRHDHVAAGGLADPAGLQDAVATDGPAVGQRGWPSPGSSSRTPRSIRCATRPRVVPAARSWRRKQATGFGAMLWFDVAGRRRRGQAI